MKRCVITAAPLALASLLTATSVQAGTAAYYATCHFLDRGNNNGGSVAGMPCYAVEGANMHGAFFHILWQDGVKTRLNAGMDEPLADQVTGRTYTRINSYTFSANADGDVISLDNVEYTNDRYSVDDAALLERLQN